LAQTDSAPYRKRSATYAALKDDASEDNGSLFPDSDGELTDSDKRAKNHANGRQISPLYAQFLICKNEVYLEMSSRSRSTKIDHHQLE
jgi:hypothetical protein